MAKLATAYQSKVETMTVNIDALKTGGADATVNAVIEGMEMATYKFDKYLSNKSTATLDTITLDTKEKEQLSKNFKQ